MNIVYQNSTNRAQSRCYIEPFISTSPSDVTDYFTCGSIRCYHKNCHKATEAAFRSTVELDLQKIRKDWETSIEDIRPVHSLERLAQGVRDQKADERILGNLNEYPDLYQARLRTRPMWPQIRTMQDTDHATPMVDDHLAGLVARYEELDGKSQ